MNKVAGEEIEEELSLEEEIDNEIDIFDKVLQRVIKRFNIKLMKTEAIKIALSIYNNIEN